MGSLQDHQIVCLTHDDRQLYGEVIQVIAERQLCWVRPIALVQLAEGQILQLQDLQEGSDIVLPIALFREALDTELLPLLPQLADPSHKLEGPIDPTARHTLHQFVQTICQVYPHLFH
ncbi:MAG: hypothetical protein VKJ24_08910 [Synechococcales bacterium]|nr:hypothetical protein [Synechococcales bacterium]